MNYLRNFLHFRLIYRSRLKSLRPSPCHHAPRKARMARKNDVDNDDVNKFIHKLDI